MYEGFSIDSKTTLYKLNKTSLNRVTYSSYFVLTTLIGSKCFQYVSF